MDALAPAVDRPVSIRNYRLAVGAFFFVTGLTFASWASRIPNLQERLALSETQLGGVLFALPVGLMLSLPISGWLVARLGSRRVVGFSTACYCLTLVALGLAQTTWHLVAGLFFFGLVGNLTNIAVNTQAVGVEALYKRTIMASFHGVWSLAGFTGAGIGTLMIGQEVPPALHFSFIAVLAVLAILISTRYTLQDTSQQQKGQPLFVMPDKSLINLGVIAFCSMICEGTMFDWSGVYFQKVVGAQGAWIGAGYTAFMFTMAGTRFVADSFTSRFGLKRILQLSGVLTASGLLIAVLFPSLPTAILGFLLVGAGVSSVVPLIYSAAGRSTAMSPSVALAAVSTIGFFGFLFGPPLIGLVAGATSLRISFSLIAVMGLCIALVASRTKSLV